MNGVSVISGTNPNFVEVSVKTNQAGKQPTRSVEIKVSSICKNFVAVCELQFLRESLIGWFVSRLMAG